MALALGSVLGEQDNGPATGPFAYSFTNTAGNLLLVSFTLTSGDNATGVTYNGVAMTQWVKRQYPRLGWFLYIYALPSPATGANNVSISYTGSASIRAFAVSYTGYGGSATPDATSSGDPATGNSMTGSITSVADNCWQFMFAIGNNGISASSGCTNRGGASNPAMFDSNAAKTPAGSVSFVVTTGGTSSDWTYVMVSFSPTGSSAIKTVNGLAIGSVKTINGLALASVKNWNGLA